MTAAEATLAYEAGAYPGFPVTMGEMCIFAPYAIPNMQVDRLRRGGQQAQNRCIPRPGAMNAALTRRSNRVYRP
jgi:hypothetical protein